MTATLSNAASAASGLAAAHVTASNAASERFFESHADSVARACHAMALRFQAGGRLLAYGTGAQRSDVSHVVVEFVHPVIVGKRALPAVGLVTARTLDVLGHPQDALMLLCAGAPTEADRSLLARAKARGMLVLALTGATTGVDADFHFAVPSDHPLIVQETHEMLYHVLWELVHVFFEHRSGE
jgi:D-sedoheptulose 7-phosphate isomerase